MSGAMLALVAALAAAPAGAPALTTHAAAGLVALFGVDHGHAGASPMRPLDDSFGISWERL
jgi:hypothetical protein